MYGTMNIKFTEKYV